MELKFSYYPIRKIVKIGSVPFYNTTIYISFAQEGTYLGFVGGGVVMSPGEFLELAYGRDKNFYRFLDTYAWLNQLYMEAYLEMKFKMI